jgi:hypothetical protein
MKKLSIAVIFFLTTAATAFAKPAGTGLTFRGQDDFNKRFPNATDVIASKVDEQLTEVSFTWNGLKLEAFYDEEGSPVATARYIAVSSLPLSVQLSLSTQYSNFVDTEVIEYYDQNEGLSYYVTEVGEKASYMLHVSTGGSISVFKKMKN